jgi:hypothetical protein
MGNQQRGVDLNSVDLAYNFNLELVFGCDRRVSRGFNFERELMDF